MLSLRDSMHIFVRIRTTQKRLDGHFVCILAHTVVYTSCYTRIQTRSRSRVYRHHAIPCIYTYTHIPTHTHTYTYTDMFITLCLLALCIYTYTHIYTNMLITLCLLALCVILGPLDIMKYLRELTGETDDQLKALTTLDLSGTHSALPTTNTALSLTHYPSTQQQRSPVTSDPHAYRMLTILSTLTRTRTKTFNPSQNTNSDPNTTPLCSHQRSTHRPYRTLTIMSALMRIITILHNPSPNTYKLCVVQLPSVLLSTLTFILTIINTLSMLTRMFNFYPCPNYIPV